MNPAGAPTVREPPLGLPRPDTTVPAYIAGQWVDGLRTFGVDDPATGHPVAEVTDCTVLDAHDAADAAASAQPVWAARAPADRADTLHRVHGLMLRESVRLADLIVLENGKSAADAEAEVHYAAQFFRWFAEEAVRGDGSYTTAPGGQSKTIVTRAPVGIAALVTPWNFPAAMPARKIAPALAAGCSVVLKPAAETPLTAVALARLLEEAGVPAGVVNVVPTLDAPGVVGAWLTDDRIRKLSFTGSTAVGRQLLNSAAARVMNCSMELGGTAPFIVLPDADIEHAVSSAMVAKFRSGGQACTAANSFHVHSGIASEFTEALAQSVSRLTVGPATSGAEIGPLISAKAVDRLAAAVQTALDGGARQVVSVNTPTGSGGYYSPPTVLSNVAVDSALVTEELFGPVAPVVVWDDLDELVARLNRSVYGLAAYVESADLRAALRVAERLETGMVAVNRGVVSDPAAPFGGTKQSGLGREGGRHGFHEFTEVKYISVDWP